MIDHTVIELTNWAFSLGGEHFSGFVYSLGGEREEIKQIMTSGLASRLNKKDGGISYKEGATTHRFETEESAIKKGIELSIKKYPNIKYILFGSYAVADPQKIVWCRNEHLKDKLNLIFTEFDAYYNHDNDPYKTHEYEMNGLYAKFEQLIKEVIKDE